MGLSGAGNGAENGGGDEAPSALGVAVAGQKKHE